MIIGIGTDIIENARVGKAIKSKHFIERVYTLREQNYCNSRGPQRTASYAARFAGKEAFFKALGTGIVCSLTCIEILNDEFGRPYINLIDNALELTELIEKLNVKNIHISLSHSKDYSIATCILENY